MKIKRINLNQETLTEGKRLLVKQVLQTITYSKRKLVCTDIMANDLGFPLIQTIWIQLHNSLSISASTLGLSLLFCFPIRFIEHDLQYNALLLT